jgi:radical SAM protein with 4Fe4S-binding SPASM domain
MIKLIKDQGILVGLSTHGDLFPELLEACQDLDYITISVDSITRRNEIRKGSFYDSPEAYLSNLFNSVSYFAKKKIPVDLQFIELKGWEKERDILEKYLNPRLESYFYKDWVTVRSIPDCCILHRSETRLKKEEDPGLCLNPWMSVSIQSNGNVSSCCFSWGDDKGNNYGNLYENSLEEIWNGPEVKRLREDHQRGFAYLPNLCMKCYTRSPVLLHWELYLNSVVSSNRQHRIISRINDLLK